MNGKHSSDQFEETASSYIVHRDGEAARGLESGHRLLQRLYDGVEDIEYVDVYDEKVGEENGEDLIDVERLDEDGEMEKHVNGSGYGRDCKDEAEVGIGNHMKKNNIGNHGKKNKTPKKAVRGGVVLVITSSMKDAAIFVRDNPTLFAAKTREVVVMGGCKPITDHVALDATMARSSLNYSQSSDISDTSVATPKHHPKHAKQHQSLSTSASSVDDKNDVWSQLAKIECEPDSAHNNTFDPSAASFFYSQCQKMNITLTIVSRFAAYAAKMPRSVYDDLALTGSSIGWRLRNSQRASIDQLWQRACSRDPNVRKGLPPRCDRKWFIDTFCGGDDDDSRCCDDTAWDLVTGFMQYDTIALLAAVPGVRENYFDPFVLPPLEKSVEEKKEDTIKWEEEKERGVFKGGKPRVNPEFRMQDKDCGVLDNSHGEKIEEDDTAMASREGRASYVDVTKDKVGRRLSCHSDPGPGAIQRAIARANADNKNLEGTDIPPVEVPRSNIPVAFGRGTRNLIGISDKEHNLKNPKLLVNLLKTGYRSGILCNHHTQPHIILHLQLRWDNLADTLLTCLMLRSLWDMRLASVLGVIVSVFPSDSDDTKPPLRDEMNNPNGREKEGDGKTIMTNDETKQCSFDSTGDDESFASTPDQSPSTLRALAESIRATLSSIGLSHVKFLVVSGTSMEEHKKKSSEAFLELYESSPPIGVTLVLTATFTSVWPFAESYSELFRDKTVRVVHTGGALIWPARWGWAALPFSPKNDDREDSSQDLNSGELTEEKILVPDPAAQNHRLDLSSARQFYKRAQALSVPLVILSRHVAKECCIPRNFFDVLGSHGGVVGQRICNSERNSLLNLWRCACAPSGSAARGNLPERCDANWFAETFCAGRRAGNEEELWKRVEAVNLYR